jgi:metal-sulfur cluster biosynthetic enzyme
VTFDRRGDLGGQPESNSERVQEIWHTLNQIVDPCSIAMSTPLGIADLGLIERIDVSEGFVAVDLVPTSPHCLFIGLFEEEVEQRIAALPWVKSLRVEINDGGIIWDETRMTHAARTRIAEHRAALRRTPQPRVPTE